MRDCGLMVRITPDKHAGRKAEGKDQQRYGKSDVAAAHRVGVFSFGHEGKLAWEVNSEQCTVNRGMMFAVGGDFW